MQGMSGKTDRGTKPAVDNRLITDLSPVREALFVPGCRPVERRLFVSVNPFHARHVREFSKYFEFPDMPCMKRVYRDKKSIGPLVSS